MRNLVKAGAASPHLLMWLCFGAVVAGAWAYLVAITPFGLHSGFTSDLLASLCLTDDDPWSRRSIVAALVMWSAMVLAMMLPSAAPMVATYIDISEAASEKSIAVAPPIVLCLGYLLVWLVFSVAMAVLQARLQQAGMLSGGEVLAHPLSAAVVLIGAGAYQFTAIKHACLQKCVSPMPWFLANWREDVAGVLMNGIRQGSFCVACCWAMMMVMFVTGLMNLFWMAAIGLVMIAEKTVANAKPVSYASGSAMIGGGVVYLYLATGI